MLRRVTSCGLLFLGLKPEEKKKGTYRKTSYRSEVGGEEGYLQVVLFSGKNGKKRRESPGRLLVNQNNTKTVQKPEKRTRRGGFEGYPEVGNFFQVVVGRKEGCLPRRHLVDRRVL